MRKRNPLNNGGAASHPVEEIAGLGIIRLRALRKAGYETVEAVRAASEEQLAAIPGISPMKARAILEQLNGGKKGEPVSEDRTDSKPPVRRVRRRIAPPVEPPVPPIPAADEPPMLAAAKAISNDVSALLSSSEAASLERRLARQLGRAALAAERIVGDDRLQTWTGKKLNVCIAKLKSTLVSVAAAGQLSARKQEKLADTLRSLRKDVEIEIDSVRKKLKKQAGDA